MIFIAKNIEYEKFDTPYDYGYQQWRKFKLIHRLMGPAIIFHYGNKEWYKEGLLIKCEYK
jgi:hypothetical protein